MKQVLAVCRNVVAVAGALFVAHAAMAQNAIVDYAGGGQAIKTEVTSMLTANWLVLLGVGAAILAISLIPRLAKRFIK